MKRETILLGKSSRGRKTVKKAVCEDLAKPAINKKPRMGKLEVKKFQNVNKLLLSGQKE